ncbi:MaoC family dehydratase [Streptomyces sp. NPDC059787]|uniref:MaoC family dehydratase n=1 Tax=Streptomyces sp. NPDC059787 TaxID=3346947 RepID=UPI0036641E6E
MAPTLSPAPSHGVAAGTVLTGRHLVTARDAEAFRALCAVASAVPLTGAVPGTVAPAQLAAVALRMCERLLETGPSPGGLVAVHGTQRLRVERAAAVGEPLVSRAEVRSVRPLGAGTATEVAVTLAADDGSAVAESVSLLVHSPGPVAGPAPAVTRPAATPLVPQASPPTARQAVPPAAASVVPPVVPPVARQAVPPAAASVVPPVVPSVARQAIPPAAASVVPPAAPEGARCSSYTVTRELVRRYAELSGDHNPIHLSPEAARAGGFDDLIAHGMLTFALVAHHLAGAVGEAAGTELQLRFSRPLTVPAEGATLTVRDLPAAGGALAVTAVDGAGLPVAGGRAAPCAHRQERGRDRD